MLRSVPSSYSWLRAALFALSALALCYGTAAAHRGPPSGRAASLETALRRDLDEYLKTHSGPEHLSSLSLAVGRGTGQPVLLVTAGTARYRAGASVVPASLYQIGSNTKAFTAVAVLQLEAQGRLSIDAPIGRYLPQYPAYAALTLRRLLNMTSGLESYDNLPAWERAYVSDPNASVSADSLIRLVYPNIKYPPGTRYHYSNTGYLLAQKVVEARSRTHRFDAEMARIIASAGLHDTYYTSDVYPRSIARRVVAGYYENDDTYFGRFRGRDVSGYSLSWAQGAGSIVSTPRDLARWARALYRGASLLPRKQQDELTSLVSVRTARSLPAPTSADPAAFGLGVAERFDPKLGTFWFYQGETLGFRAAHLYFPASNLVVSLFANSRPVEAKSHLQSLFATLYADIMAKSRQSR